MRRSHRTAFVIAALMLGGSLGAVIARPNDKAIAPATPIGLMSAIPSHFGDWQELPQHVAQIVNPQLESALDEIYSEILERTYVNSDGYRIMLSVAYGPDQRGSLKAHGPEFCYEGAGFFVSQKEETELTTPFGTIPVTRLFATKRQRQEPITYWTMIGDRAVKGWQSRLIELSYVVTGGVPDGLVFRVSSLDADRLNAYQVHKRFIIQLLQDVSPASRKRLSGLEQSKID